MCMLNISATKWPMSLVSTQTQHSNICTCAPTVSTCCMMNRFQLWMSRAKLLLRCSSSESPRIRPSADASGIVRNARRKLFAWFQQTKKFYIVSHTADNCIQRAIQSGMDYLFMQGFCGKIISTTVHDPILCFVCLCYNAVKARKYFNFLLLI